MGKIIDLSKAELRYNSEWLDALGYPQIGAHADMFSVADFIARENIKKRLDAGKRVSLRELLYPLMQGYDSVAINADVELGGTDQKCNLLAGRTMQEKMRLVPQNILMMPLINGLDGRKMSSSWGNVITLNMSAADMYGKVMSMRDEEIPIYFETCTRVPMTEVREISQGLADNMLHPKEVKMRLARAIVTLYHSADAAQKAEEGFTNVFSDGGVPDDGPTVSVSSIDNPTLRSCVVDVLDTPGFVKSVGELRRLVEQGAVSEVGGEVFTNIDTPITRSMTIRVGKHRFVKIEIR